MKLQVCDLNRGILAIRYNCLNLSDTIPFDNGNQIVKWYDALNMERRLLLATTLFFLNKKMKQRNHALYKTSEPAITD